MGFFFISCKTHLYNGTEHGKLCESHRNRWHFLFAHLHQNTGAIYSFGMPAHWLYFLIKPDIYYLDSKAGNIVNFIFKISSYQTKLLKMSTPIRPVTETIVSIIVQVRKVCRMVKLKYSLNNQKPPSFTCENIRLPAPIDSTINSGRMC